ncbi:toll/interleukin-1 receptor domain-containing protein [Pseudarthrobacter sp. NCCP-2145]|uniref:toll/interleukin-1 receptor domain-containing protein n=1 Tax=Pseudarthrobacter sp. NCCP-2145 TaxID=2942290 RepID=UPI00203AB29B|nr:toll/interleukin-1 receptor domain-containing protein [Pseudarthrobacter sp. NCCP-2145]GKV74642.1 hypothetical protein NCCP2145_40230 [Pseudarthrobacter sp. NCCP-2145]
MAGSLPTASGRIFISYRREETAYPAGWLYDRLADRYGGGQVFKDVDSIQLGDDFVEAITRAVGSCDVVLVLIGDKWITIADEHGKRRLDDADDFVRLEIQAALTRNVRVIPILVDGARMPRADELPESLAKLVRRQALEFSPARFEFDTSRLFKVLDGTLAEMRKTQEDDYGVPAPAVAAEPGATTGVDPKPLPRQRGHFAPRTLILGGAAAVTVVILLAVLLLANLQNRSSPSANTAGGQAPVQAGGGGGGIDVDGSTVTSEDGLQLSGLQATSRRDPESPRVGDTVTVSYALTNTTDQRLQLEYTFVGVRDPAGDNKDAEDMNEGRALAPGETVTAQGRVLLNAAGGWAMWPCYVLSGDRFCPDRWQVFFVLAE